MLRHARQYGAREKPEVAGGPLIPSIDHGLLKDVMSCLYWATVVRLDGCLLVLDLYIAHRFCGMIVYAIEYVGLKGLVCCRIKRTSKKNYRIRLVCFTGGCQPTVQVAFRFDELLIL